MAAPYSKAYSLAWVGAAYAAALAAAAAVLYALPADWPAGLAGWYATAVRLLMADVAATLAVFGFSFARGNTSLYDPYWSVAPPVAVVYLLLAYGPVAPVRAGLVGVVVLVWGTRLTYNWLRGWAGLHQEDWRYVDFQRKMGRWYWLVSCFGLHLFPTLQVFLGLLPVLPALIGQGSRAAGWLDGVAFVVAAGAVTIEAVADAQLHRFRKRADRPQGSFLQTGLWRYSRHPNYFGEVGFWVGLWLFGLAADPAYWWTGLGWVAMLVMFFGYSIPAQDARMAASRPGYRAYMRRTAPFVPWWPGHSGERERT
jgi:steroid 5-alpha reductase family enzyme